MRGARRRALGHFGDWGGKHGGVPSVLMCTAGAASSARTARAARAWLGAGRSTRGKRRRGRPPQLRLWSPRQCPTTRRRATLRQMTALCRLRDSRGPPKHPEAPYKNSWLYIPLLHAAAGTLSSEAASAWNQHPRCGERWSRLVCAPARAEPLHVDRLAGLLHALADAEGEGCADAAALSSALGGDGAANVSLSRALSCLVDGSGYLPALGQAKPKTWHDCISRAAFLSKLCEVAPELVPFARLFHGRTWEYQWWDDDGDDDGVRHGIRQAEGCEQGDPLGPSPFCPGPARGVMPGRLAAAAG